MSLEGLSDEEIQQREQELLDRIRASNNRSGNISLMRALNWTDGLYWSIRDRLVDAGILETGRGKGGSIRFVEENHKETEEHPVTEPPTEVRREAEEMLYDPMSKVVRETWVRSKRFRQSIVEVTGKQGRKSTGGKWTRPDITVAGMRTFPFVPGKHFDIVTFEVKQMDALDVTAVYEALAHRRCATKSYVLLHVPETIQGTAEVDEALGAIAEEAKRHGVGLIVAARPDDFGSWDERVDATRHEPEPEHLNNFIAKQLSAGAREEILTWFR